MADAVVLTSGNRMKRVLGIRDFLFLWIGQGTSMLGDQFQSIAAAWLVLKLTGDPLALGAVLAVGGIPRAIFTIVGGAITDRISPRRLMILTDLIRLVLSALLALQVFTATLQPWMVYLYSLFGGIVSGLFAPASMSMAPRLVSPNDLQTGNSVMQGSTQLIGFVGPAIAGALIAAFPGKNVGVGLAIAFNALTFVVSVVTLWMMHAGGELLAPVQAARKASVLQSIHDGFSYMLLDPVLRSTFILLAVANMAFGGPVLVGIPYLANTRFPEGAAAYGLIISGYAGGNLLGILLAGALPKMVQKTIRVFLVAMFAAFALGIAVLAWINLTWLAMAILFVLGVMNGYLAIFLITGLQRTTPQAMLGRLMSMVLLGNLAFMPLSQAMAGVILRWNVPALFLVSGGLLGGCTIYLAVPQIGLLLSAGLAADQTSTFKVNHNYETVENSNG